MYIIKTETVTTSLGSRGNHLSKTDLHPAHAPPFHFVLLQQELTLAANNITKKNNPFRYTVQILLCSFFFEVG